MKLFDWILRLDYYAKSATEKYTVGGRLAFKTPDEAERYARYIVREVKKSAKELLKDVKSTKFNVVAMYGGDNKTPFLYVERVATSNGIEYPELVYNTEFHPFTYIECSEKDAKAIDAENYFYELKVAEMNEYKAALTDKKNKLSSEVLNTADEITKISDKMEKDALLHSGATNVFISEPAESEDEDTVEDENLDEDIAVEVDDKE